MSESQKRIPSILVIHYCAWYPFLQLRRYIRCYLKNSVGIRIGELENMNINMYMWSRYRLYLFFFQIHRGELFKNSDRNPVGKADELVLVNRGICRKNLKSPSKLNETKISKLPDEGDPSNITSSPAQESSKSDAESSIAKSSQLDFWCSLLFLDDAMMLLKQGSNFHWKYLSLALKGDDIGGESSSP